MQHQRIKTLHKYTYNIYFSVIHNRSFVLQNVRVDHLKLVCLQIVSAFGVILGLYEIYLLVKNNLEGHISESHYWFYRCSQLSSWVSYLDLFIYMPRSLEIISTLFLTSSMYRAFLQMVLLLASKLEHWFYVFCNPILCFWWILKPLLEIPHLLWSLSSLEVLLKRRLECIKLGSHQILI